MSRDQVTDWDLQRDQANALERIADAIEAIAKPKDQANLGLALQLQAAEKLAADRLLQLQAVEYIVKDGTISEAQKSERLLAHAWRGAAMRETDGDAE